VQSPTGSTAEKFDFNEILVEQEITDVEKDFYSSAFLGPER
jgi:hypothetical protein